MPIAPTIKYFGQNPTTIVMQSSSQFDGTAQTGTPVITPGLYTFPAQAGGGLFNLHEYPIVVSNISYAGGGTLSIYRMIGAVQILLGTITTQGAFAVDDGLQLPPGESLKFVSSGATTPVLSITSREMTSNQGM